MSGPARHSVFVRLLIVTGCVGLTLAYLGRVSRAEVVPVRQPLATLPFTIGGWAGHPQPRFEDNIEAVLGVDDYIVRAYSRANEVPVWLYIGYHDSQRQGDTIHSPLNCLPGAGWQPLSQGRAVVTIPDPHDGAAARSIEVNRVVIGKGLDRQLVYYWYQSHRRVVASEYWGKIYTVLDAIRYNRTDAALVRVIVPMGSGQADDELDELAVDFITALFPLLGAHFPE